MVFLDVACTIFVFSAFFSSLASGTASVPIGMGTRTFSILLDLLNMIYYLVYSSLLLCGVISKDQPDVRRFFYLLWLFVLFIFAGFRLEVGCDWDGYKNIFERLRYVDVFDAAQQREPLFSLANTLLHHYELEYPYINVICSFIFFLGMHRLAKREPDPYGILVLAFPVLIINLPMSGIRQGAALGILCFAYNAFNDKKLIRFVFLVIVASGLHSSAVFFLILAPFVHGELTRRRIVIAGIITLPVAARFFATLDSFREYSDNYAGASSVIAAGGPFRTGLLALTGAWFLLRFRSDWQIRSIHDYKLVWFASFMMIATFLVSLFSSVIGDRFGYYLVPIQLVFLARLPFLAPGSPIVALVPYVAAAAYFVVWTQTSALFEKCYIPYKFWWVAF